jgi:hypothetical protein
MVMAESWRWRGGTMPSSLVAICSIRCGARSTETAAASRAPGLAPEPTTRGGTVLQAPVRHDDGIRSGATIEGNHGRVLGCRRWSSLSDDEMLRIEVR